MSVNRTPVENWEKGQALPDTDPALCGECHDEASAPITRQEFFAHNDRIRQQIADLFHAERQRGKIASVAAELYGRGACNGSITLCVKAAREIVREVREQETRERALMVALHEVTTEEVRR